MSQLGLRHLSENIVSNPVLKFPNSTSSKLLWHFIHTQTFCKALTILLISTIQYCGASKLSSSSDEISLSLDDEESYIIFLWLAEIVFVGSIRFSFFEDKPFTLLLEGEFNDDFFCLLLLAALK